MPKYSVRLDDNKILVEVVGPLETKDAIPKVYDINDSNIITQVSGMYSNNVFRISQANPPEQIILIFESAKGSMIAFENVNKIMHEKSVQSTALPQNKESQGIEEKEREVKVHPSLIREAKAEIINIKEDSYYREIQNIINLAQDDPDLKGEQKETLEQIQQIYKLIISFYENEQIQSGEIVDILFAYNSFVYTYLSAIYLSYNSGNGEKKLGELENLDELKAWVENFIHRIGSVSNHKSIASDFSGIFGSLSYEDMTNGQTFTAAHAMVEERLKLGIFSLLTRYGDINIKNELTAGEKSIKLLDFIRDPVCGLNSSKNYATTAGAIFTTRSSVRTTPELISQWLGSYAEIPIAGMYGHKESRDKTVKQQLCDNCENEQDRFNIFLQMKLHEVIQLDNATHSAIERKKVDISKSSKMFREGFREEIVSIIQEFFRKNLDEISASLTGVISKEFLEHYVEAEEFKAKIHDLGDYILMWYSPSKTPPPSRDESPALVWMMTDGAASGEVSNTLPELKRPASMPTFSSHRSILFSAVSNTDSMRSHAINSKELFHPLTYKPSNGEESPSSVDNDVKDKEKRGSKRRNTK